MAFSILFDMDGVLVDSEPVINEAAILGLREYGVNAEPEDFLPFVGAGEDKYVGGVAEKYGVPYKVEMKHRVYQIYLEIVPQKIKLFEGVHELLEFLQQNGVKTALASSADRIKIQANLKAANIPQTYFKKLVSGEDVANKKPAPDIYLYAAASIGADPAECIVVEDALNGLKAAKAAGMRSIAVASSFTTDVLKSEAPDYIVDCIADVMSLLKVLP